MPTSALEMTGWCALAIVMLMIMMFVLLLMATPRARHAENASFAAEAEENDRQPGDGF